MIVASAPPVASGGGLPSELVSPSSDPPAGEATAGETSADQAAGRFAVGAWQSKWLLATTAALLVGVVALALLVVAIKRDRTVDPVVVAGAPSMVVGEVVPVAPTPRTLEPYVGLGTWIDRFDFSPPYTGDNPPVQPADVAEMNSQGVRTLYLQASHRADRSPGLTEDPWVLAEFLLAAHQHDMAVVAWYLPKWESEDLGKIKAMADFSFLGHRFDGIGIDIEYNQDGLEPLERSQRLVQLSRRVHRHVGDDPLAAIVLPPVLTEEVNPDFWPQFPWRQLAPLYDVWMPMSYWSFRSESSGYNDGYTYNTESTRLLRELIGDDDALVHGIGGIGAADASEGGAAGSEPLATVGDLQGFAESLRDTGSIGGSMYDWVTLDAGARRVLSELFASGAASALPGLSGP